MKINWEDYFGKWKRKGEFSAVPSSERLQKIIQNLIQELGKELTLGTKEELQKKYDTLTSLSDLLRTLPSYLSFDNSSWTYEIISMCLHIINKQAELLYIIKEEIKGG